MRKRIGFIIIGIVIFPVLFNGCWNYREINRLSIVSGFAIDKNQSNDKYILTAEIASFMTGGKEAEIKGKTVESEGETVFEAIRSMLQLSGHRLYWGHSKIVVVSEEIAGEGMSKVLDLIYRDAEVRTDMYVLVSKGKTAKEVFLQQGITSALAGYEVMEMLASQKNAGKAPSTKIYQYIGAISNKMAAGVLPSIELKSIEGKMTSILTGTAVFKNDKLIGYLDSDETMLLMFVIKQFDKGTIVQKEFSNGQEHKITLEVFETKTKITPKYESEKLSMDIKVNIEASIGELETTENFIEEAKYKKLEKDTAAALQEKIKSIIKKVQNEFDADIFDFQKYIKANKPSVWNSIEGDWDEVFNKLPVDVEVKVKFRNSGLASKPITVGE